MISEDNTQRIKSILSIGINGYKILMATLLCIFVPQKCEDRECTLYDNFTDLSAYNMFVLIFNFITLAIFVGFYGVEYYRENWCIEHLDTDPTKPLTNLKEEIMLYPEFKEKVQQIDYIYYSYSKILCVCTVINFIVSSILIYVYYYFGFKSVTVMITYFLLVIDKLIFSLTMSKISYEEFLLHSVYMTGPIYFNVIDADYKKIELTNI